MSETSMITKLKHAWQKFGRKPYIYKPLSSEHAIRLIRFIDVDTLECELIEVESIEVAPKYVALSYTWGDTTDPGYIGIDGQLLSVTRNLHDALRHLARWCTHNETLFWADAICINQADRDERAKQVLLMKHLYERAFRVDVWLGLAADDSDLAMDTMVDWLRELSRRAKSRPSGESLEAILTTIKPDDDIFYRPSRSQVTKAIIAYEKLIRRRWWYRAWILQESTGPAETQFVCGSRRAPFSSFVVFSQIAKQDLHYREPPPEPKGVNTNILYRLQLARTRSLSPRSLMFLELLHTARRFFCTDPRDHIYAILAMASEVQRGDIVPDYHLDIKSVFLEVVKLVLHKHPDRHRLDFLGYAIRSAKESKGIEAFDNDFPSWLPDWRTQTWVVLPKFCQDNGTSQIDILYHASGDTVPSTTIDGDAMSFLGFHIDTIVSTMHIIDVESPNIDYLGIFRSLSSLCTSDKYPTDESRYDAFIHTVVADTNFGSVADCERDFALDLSLMESRSASLDPTGRHKQSQMHNVIINAQWGRRLCWTQQGFLALVPAAAQPGDSICCFYGGQVLYCLRARDESTYEFLGECYVHGLMDGEAFKYRQSEEMFKLT